MSDEAARRALAVRLDRAVAALPDAGAPLVVVDLDAFDGNADDLAARADGTPLRLASKSVRVPALVSRALAHPGFRGVLGYTVREAHWLVREGLADDVVVGYPSVDRAAVRDVLADPLARAAVTFMVDEVAHLDLIASCDPACTAAGPPRVALDVDAGLRLDLRVRSAHVGPRRSPVREVDDVLRLARAALDRGLRVVGVMTYEGQVAGVPDDEPSRRARSAVVRRLKRASLDQLVERRAAIAAALGEVVELEFWNAGGSGSVEATRADPVVTEVAAGSGLLVPTLFDHYRSFSPRPAAFYALSVVRRPAPGLVTVAGGGFSASGAAGPDRAPTPWAPPGLHLTPLEGAGEVQTPLRGPDADRLRLGDHVWFRHAKSGELFEHTGHVHLVSGDRVVETVPSYRGLGLAW